MHKSNPRLQRSFFAMPYSSESSPPNIEVFSPSDIGRRINRNQTTIWRAIERLGLAAVVVSGSGFRFYDEAQIAKIEASLKPRRGHRAS